MIPLANIQAEGDDLGGLLQLLVLVAVIIVIGVAKWLGSKLEQKQAEQQAAEQTRRKLEAGQASQASPPPRQQAGRQEQIYEAPYPTPAPQQRRRQPQAPPPIVLEPARQHGLVDAEVALPSAVHHDAYLRSIREATTSAARPASAAMVDLSSTDALRQAVIYYELLSPPKALRRGPEQWEI